MSHVHRPPDSSGPAILEETAARYPAAIPDLDSIAAHNPTVTNMRAPDPAGQAQAVAGVGIWQYDYALDLVTWSEEEFRIFGVCPDTFRPTFANFLALVHPDDRDAMQAADNEAASGKPMNFEHRIVRPDGEVRHVHQQAQIVIRDERTGRAILIGTTQDVTARMGAERRGAAEGIAQELLSPRERATLAQIVNGASNKVAARALGISPRTVEYHRANIMRKFGARNLAELIGMALATG